MSKPYTTACPDCAEKLRKTHYLIEVEGSERVGQCRWCLRWLHVQQYEYSPHKRYVRRRRSGGGERAKSSR